MSTQDPATQVYNWLVSTANIPGRLRLLTDDVSGRRYLEIVRELAPAPYQVTYHVLTWPVSSAGATPVPVLYFNVYAVQAGRQELLTDVEKVVELLVPQVYRSQVEARPAVSQGTHPVTGLPAFFVHPCQTEEWMAQVKEAPDVYALWFQTFGQVVGL